MMKLISTAALLCVISTAHQALATVDRAAVLTDFHLIAFCDKPAGNIVIDGTQDRTGITNLAISAFGKKVVLNTTEISKLKSTAMNGIQISCFVPYKPGMGQVYVRFTRGTPGGTNAMKFIALHEDGSVEIE